MRHALGQAFVHKGSEVWTKRDITIEKRRVLEQEIVDEVGREVVTHYDGELGCPVSGVDVRKQFQPDEFEEGGTGLLRKEGGVAVVAVFVSGISLHDADHNGFRHILPVTEIVDVAGHWFEKVVGIQYDHNRVLLLGVLFVIPRELDLQTTGLIELYGFELFVYDLRLRNARNTKD